MRSNSNAYLKEAKKKVHTAKKKNMRNEIVIFSRKKKSTLHGSKCQMQNESSEKNGYSNYFKYIEGHNQFNTYYMFYRFFNTRNPGIHQPALIVPNQFFLFHFDFQFPPALQHAQPHLNAVRHTICLYYFNA